MLNEVSCLHVDWNAVGAVSTAFASGVALWVATSAITAAKKESLKNARVAKAICQAEVRRLKDVGLAISGGSLGFTREENLGPAVLQRGEIHSLTRWTKMLDAPLLKKNWALLVALPEREAAALANAAATAERLRDLMSISLSMASASFDDVAGWITESRSLVRHINSTRWLDEELKAYFRSFPHPEREG